MADYASKGQPRSNPIDAPCQPSLNESSVKPVSTNSFAEFYRNNFHSLVVLASAVADDTVFAEDIVQETMSLVHDRWTELHSRNTARAWARRTVVNRSIDRKRRLVRERNAVPRLWEPKPTSVAPIENRVLWDAVRALPTKQRVALVLFYVDGYSTDELADVLEISGSSARSTLHRARRSLSGVLGSRSEYEGAV